MLQWWIQWLAIRRPPPPREFFFSFFLTRNEKKRLYSAKHASEIVFWPWPPPPHWFSESATDTLNTPASLMTLITIEKKQQELFQFINVSQNYYIAECHLVHQYINIFVINFHLSTATGLVQLRVGFEYCLDTLLYNGINCIPLELKYEECLWKIVNE